ncbi:MAG: hypothetical protein WC815_09730 [Vicinamibacterales bacterium]
MLTWPLAAGLGRDVPGDLGDSLLNMWILAWGAQHLPGLLTGGMGWQQFWDANIFHPAPLALTMSEHLFGQVLQILPVYWITGNIILCYNLLFLSTFVLSAFGTYLLVRDLTGDRRSAFIAGLVYGFLPYRIASVPHIQVMSSQWMPFALYGLNRFVTGGLPRRSSTDGVRAKAGSRRALAGGTFALVMQNWSCGYYLLYFAPFAPLFVVHRMWAAKKLADARIWIGLVAAAGATMALTLPFLLPYTKSQQLFGFERPFGEVVQFSANVWSYVTASENLWLFGKALRYYPHGEGETFLGFVPWILAAIGIVGLLIGTKGSDPSATLARGQTPRVPGSDPEQEVPRGLTPSRWRRILTWVLAVAVVTQLVGVVAALVFGGFDLDVLGVTIRARTPQRLLLQLLAAALLLLAASLRARATAARAARSPLVFFAMATVLAMWLSLGPLPNAGEVHLSGFGLYRVLYDYVPGFNGVRVPARYAMLAGLFLAVMAGYGMARRGQTPRHIPLGVRPLALTVVVALLILLEGAAIPMEMNRTWAQNEAMPPARVVPAAQAPPVYARVAALPAGSAITEFPFGDAAWEIRYVYYSAAHWKPITNGYSGNFPPAYKVLVARLQRVTTDPEASWQALTGSGSTHVVLHTNAFATPADAETVRAWLTAHAARMLEQFPDGDTLFALP